MADRGPGVPAGFESALFRRFLHVDVAGDQKRIGVGLGLRVVRAIVEAPRGRVGVDPRPCGGSIFWFTIPMVETS
jgi:K+-sensing histidine kinase KdpD